MKNLLFVFIASTQLYAGIAEFVGTPKTVTASGVTAQVFPEAVLNTGDQKINLKLTGFGIRKKPVLFTKVNVYVAASYLDDVSKVNLEQPLASVKDAKARVMQLTFLRNLSGAEVRQSMEEALILNEVDVNSTAFQTLFNSFNFDISAGQTTTVVTFNKGGNLENVTIEVPSTRFSTEGNFVGFDLWKGWFGIPADDGLKDLQPQLLTVK